MAKGDVLIRVQGLGEVERKLGMKFIATPEFEHIRDRLLERINRDRRTLGYRNNPLVLQAVSLGANNEGLLARVTSPLNWPRQTGAAWVKFVFQLVKGSFMRNQIRAAIRRIEQRWAE